METLAEVHPHTPELLWRSRPVSGGADAALQSFYAPGCTTRTEMGFFGVADWIKDTSSIWRSKGAALWEKFSRASMKRKSCRLSHLRRTVIFGDANDYNVRSANPGRSRANREA